MRFSDFLPVQSLLESTGQNILAWRDDLEAKQIHSELDFKTEADSRAHEMIKVGLKALYPGVVVISEEDAMHLEGRPDAYWLIDPIDGTASWYNGFDGFVTQAAYIENNIPVFGAIHAPVLKKTWIALEGLGARLNGVPMTSLVANDRLIVIDNTARPKGITARMASVLPCTGYIECGSLGLKSALVADGTADLFVKDVCVRDWDLAPAAVILQEVGGILCLATGEAYPFYGVYEKGSGFIVARDASLMSSALDAYHTIQGRNQ